MILSLYEIDWIKRASKNLPERKKEEEAKTATSKPKIGYMNQKFHPNETEKGKVKTSKPKIGYMNQKFTKEETVNEVRKTKEQKERGAFYTKLHVGGLRDRAAGNEGKPDSAFNRYWEGRSKPPTKWTPKTARQRVGGTFGT